MSNLLGTVNFLDLVQERIKLVEALMRSQADYHHEDLRAALNHLLSSGGKRLRPGVVLLTAGMLGSETQVMITVSAAIEMLHTATLVHDDLIDGAFLRRGIATLNSQWSPAATVLTGDFIFARAAKLAAETDSTELMRLFAEALATIVNGEITQLFSRHSATTFESYNRRIYAKTASLFELSALAPAILNGSDESIRASTKRFGYSVGMAFQIVDDVLDFTGEQAILGKPVAGDLRQGLITLPALYYLQQNPDDPTIGLMRLGLQPESGAIERLVETIRSSGAIERSLQDARSYVDYALDAISGLPDNVYRHSLETLAKYIVDREL